jgi:ketosteroid isomerase-like protein
MVGEDRAARAADEAEIRNVVARVAQLADSDSDDFTEYLALWDAEAVTIHPTDTARGHDEIFARSVDLRRRGVQGPGTDSLHVSTTQWVKVDGDSATCRSYWLFYGNASGTPELRAMGTYHDTLVRRPDGWKLARREVGHGAEPPDIEPD